MDLSRTRAKNERWRNRNSAEYERVNRRLSELCAEVDDLESATNLYNLYVQNAGRGDNITLSIIEYSKQKQLVVRGEERVNPLIVKINEEIKSFRSAGQTRVENVEWWIPSATIVCVEGIVGGLLMLAVSFAVAGKLT